jgi:hypothetical protein
MADIWDEAAPDREPELNREWESRHQQFYNVRFYAHGVLLGIVTLKHCGKACCSNNMLWVRARRPCSAHGCLVCLVLWCTGHSQLQHGLGAAMVCRVIANNGWCLVQSGYREGLDEGMAATLQDGFNAGGHVGPD